MKQLRGIALTVFAALAVATTGVVVQMLRFRPVAQGERAELRTAPSIVVERAGAFRRATR